MTHPQQADLAALMAKAGVRQSELADALGISQSAVSRKINGRNAWRAQELRVVATLLSVPVADVLEAVAE